MIFSAHAPVRIDFAGAWTDVSYFADAFGGATLNAAIKLYVKGELSTSADDAERLGDRHGESADAGENSLINTRSALQVSYGSSIPAGSGLGTSATLNVVWLALVRQQEVSCISDKMRIAELAYDIERTLGIIGGKQDQYASAVGGINLFTFGSDGVQRRAIALSPERQAELEALLVLCYTGKARLSSNIHRNVWDNFRSGNEHTIRALFNLRDSAYMAETALKNWDLEDFASIINSQRSYMRLLDTSTTNKELEEIFELTAPDIMGGKPCGAGGGGCLFLIARNDKAKQRIKDRLQAKGLEGLDVAFDFEGLVLNRQ